MKTMGRLLRVAAVLGCFAAVVLVLTGQDNTPVLPGITVSDEHPNGCVDCHADAGGGNDYRMNVELAKVDGHPNVDAIVKTLPNDCTMCHKAGAAGPLQLIAHKLHYQNSNDNVFVNDYGGSCLQCHFLDTNTGTMTMKSGPKNW